MEATSTRCPSTARCIRSFRVSAAPSLLYIPIMEMLKSVSWALSAKQHLSNALIIGCFQACLQEQLGISTCSKL